MRNVIPKNAKLVPEQAELVFQGEIYSVWQWQQEMFDSSMGTFEMLKRPDTVKIIAIKDNKLVILEQQQPHTRLFLDIPGGMHDNPKENELDAAKRELREEAGLVCKNWKLVDVFQPHSKIEQFVYIFIAYEVVEEVEQELDAGERIKVKFTDIAGLQKMTKERPFRAQKLDIFQKVHSIEDIMAFPEYHQ